MEEVHLNARVGGRWIMLGGWRGGGEGCTISLDTCQSLSGGRVHVQGRLL